ADDPDGTNVTTIPDNKSYFRADPSYANRPYSPQDQTAIYGGKHANPTQRPLLEVGRELYTEGPYDEGYTIFGSKNLSSPHLMVYGDWRTAVGYNDNGQNEQSVLATRLNLDVDGKITATERVHAFMRPLDNGKQFTRVDLGPDNHGFEFEHDFTFKGLFRT